MQHSFDIKVAKKYGVHGAVILHNLYYWISHNKANGRHYIDEVYWTYNSLSAFEELFPYFSRQNIRTILNNLKANNAIVSKQIPEAGTLDTFYSLTKDVLELYGGYAHADSVKKGVRDNTVKGVRDNMDDVNYNIEGVNVNTHSDKNTNSNTLKYIPPLPPAEAGKQDRPVMGELEKIVRKFLTGCSDNLVKAVLKWRETKRVRKSEFGIFLQLVKKYVRECGEIPVIELIMITAGSSLNMVDWTKLKKATKKPTATTLTEAEFEAELLKKTEATLKKARGEA